MTILARCFTSQGIQAFRSLLGEYRRGRTEPPDDALLSHSAWTRPVPGRVAFEPRRWRSRLEAVEDLRKLLSQVVPGDPVVRDPGLWSWLSLASFDSVCPLRDDGTRDPGMDYRHIPSQDQRRHHRHLLKGPCDIFAACGERAIHLLQGPAHRESSMYHEVVGRQELITNPAVVDLTRLLYFDEARVRIRPNAARSAPGGIRRLATVLTQLDLTYDLHGMTHDEIIELLPRREFGPWLSGVR